MRELPKPSEIRLSDAAFRIGRSYAAAYRMLLEHDVKGRRIGRSWFVDLADVERLERERAETRADAVGQTA